MEGTEPLPTLLEASERYQNAVDDWIWEDPSTPAAILALVELAAVIAADKLVGEAVRESGPVSDETDAFHQIATLNVVGEWLNQKVVTKDWLSIGAKPPTVIAACPEREAQHERRTGRLSEGRYGTIVPRNPGRCLRSD